MLNFSSESITFPYVENNHLKTTLILANDSAKHVYYKFRVSKPKSYLVKPNQGYIKPHSSLSVIFTLQKDDINEALGHKFLLMYVGFDTPKAENYDQLFVHEHETKKFPTKITGIELTNPIINEIIADTGSNIFASAQQSIKTNEASSPIQIVNSPGRSKEMNQERVNRIETEIKEAHKYQQMRYSKEEANRIMAKARLPIRNIAISLLLGLVVGYFVLPYVQF